MVEIKSSGDLNALAANAGRHYQRAVDLNQEDFRLRALKYPLLRLSVHGLGDEDRKELVELAKAVVEERDVTNASEKITGRTSASPIAIAIAGIVASARESKWMAMLGAVVGAHAALSLSAGGKGDVGLDTIGAIVGATCMEANNFLQQAIGNDVTAFVERDL